MKHLNLHKYYLNIIFSLQIIFSSALHKKKISAKQIKGVTCSLAIITSTVSENDYFVFISIMLSVLMLTSFLNLPITLQGFSKVDALFACELQATEKN